MQLERFFSDENSDMLEYFEVQGAYGSVDSLNLLGVGYMKGSGRLKRDFKKAREQFLKCLKIDSKDVTANYKLGVMSMLGLGEDVNITKAL